YQTLLEPFDDLLANKHLLIVSAGPLTSLPLQVFVTRKPEVARPKTFAGYRNVSWLGTRQPSTILPSVASQQSLRKFAKETTAEKAYIGFGNPTLHGDGSCRGGMKPASCADLLAIRHPEDAQTSARGGAAPRSTSIDRIFRNGPDQASVLAEVRS